MPVKVTFYNTLTILNTSGRESAVNMENSDAVMSKMIPYNLLRFTQCVRFGLIYDFYIAQITAHK